MEEYKEESKESKADSTTKDDKNVDETLAILYREFRRIEKIRNRKNGNVIVIEHKGIQILITQSLTLESLVKRDQRRENSLEGRINTEMIDLPIQESYKDSEYKTKVIEFYPRVVDQKSGAEVRYVQSSHLPQIPGGKVLGMYNPSTNTIYIDDSLPAYIKEWVYYHEQYHALHGAGEQQADNYATSVVGYNPFNRFSQYSEAA